MVYRKEEIEAANERAAARLGRTATVAAAHYDRRTGRVVIDLSSGLSIAFKPQDAQGFEHAKPEQLRKIEISPSGLGLHFPVIDADIYLPALLDGFLGSRRWMAAGSRWWPSRRSGGGVCQRRGRRWCTSPASWS